MPVEDSILKTTKKFLGIGADYDAFDMDITLHINSVFSILQQLGVGPAEGFSIEDDAATWDEYLTGDLALNAVKSYMYFRVRMMFDPPATSFAMDAMTKQYQEMEWRLNVVVENERNAETSTVVSG